MQNTFTVTSQIIVCIETVKRFYEQTFLWNTNTTIVWCREELGKKIYIFLCIRNSKIGISKHT